VKVTEFMLNSYKSFEQIVHQLYQVPNLSLTMHPFSISTDEQVPLNFL